MSYIGNQPTQVAFQTDTFSGNGTTTAFTMAVAPATTTSVLVAITGVLQDPSTYSVVGTTLTFSAAPPVGTGNISVRYLGIPASGVVTTAYRTLTEFTATAGQTTFTPPSYTVGFINVYRNGALLGTADYTATNGTTIVLASAATSGDLVAVESFLVSSVLNAIPATAGSVGSAYLAGGAALANIGAGGLTQSYVGTNVAGTGPAFSARTGYTISLSAATSTAVTTYTTPDFDTNSCFTAATGRFQPNVAGYYLLISGYDSGATGTAGSYASGSTVFKNGSAVLLGSSIAVFGGTYYGAVLATTLVYLNGTTDYAQNYLFSATAVSSIRASFQGFLVRAA